MSITMTTDNRYTWASPKYNNGKKFVYHVVNKYTNKIVAVYDLRQHAEDSIKWYQFWLIVKFAAL